MRCFSSRRGKPSTVTVVMAVVGIVGIATGATIAKGFTFAVLPVILGASVVCGVIWAGGFQIGAAFAGWLESWLYK